MKAAARRVGMNPALGGRVQSPQQVHERGFSGTRCPADTDALSLGYGDRHLRQGRQLRRARSVDAAEILSFDEGACGHVVSGMSFVPAQGLGMTTL